MHPPDSDLTRKQRREQARNERKALEKEHAARIARRKRLVALGSIVAIVAVAIAAIVIATNGGGSNHESANVAKDNKTYATISPLLSGIPQSGNSLGDPKAPVTMQYYGDLECPFCRDFSLGALEPLIQKYVRTGKLKIEFRAFETATKDPEIFQKQQVAALATGKQNRMWDYVELFYHEQGEEGTEYVTENYLKSLAQQIPGLDLGKWNLARSDVSLAEEVASDKKRGTEEGISSTPSFLLSKRGGSFQAFSPNSVTDPSEFESAINKLLR